MRELILFLAVLVTGSAASRESGLRVTFNLGISIGSKFFFEMPRTVGNATAMGWVKMDRPDSPLPDLVMYCPNPPRVCCLYDPDTEYVAAIQTSVIKTEVIDPPFNWTIQGFIPWIPTANNSDSLTYMTKQIYFESEETMARSKEERMKTALADKVVRDNVVWPMGFHQKRITLPTNLTGVLDAGFTKQRCIPWMGTHYFFNMTSTTPCAADSLFSWTVLVDSDEVIGLAMVVFGKVPKTSGQRNYYERPPKIVIQALVKEGPDCLFDIAGYPTLTTLHVYFIDKPWKVGCSLL